MARQYYYLSLAIYQTHRALSVKSSTVLIIVFVLPLTRFYIIPPKK